MICQRQEEFKEPCKEQCDHCREYYAPVEEDRAAGDYADSIVGNHKHPNWHRVYDAFIAGCEYIKNLNKTSTYVDSDSNKIF